MNYISQKIRKIFNLDWFVSMLKFDFDIKKVVALLTVMVVSYIVLIPTYNLIMGLVKKSDNKSCTETLTYRKYRSINSSSCSGCASDSSSKSSNSSKSSKSSNKVKKSEHIDKKKVDKVLRKFKITE